MKGAYHAGPVGNTPDKIKIFFIPNDKSGVKPSQPIRKSIKGKDFAYLCRKENAHQLSVTPWSNNSSDKRRKGLVFTVK